MANSNLNSSKIPFVVTVLSTKGGVTKSTNAANISAFCADHGLKVLMIDTDVQPSLSSYYKTVNNAPGGIYEFIINRTTDPTVVISQFMRGTLSLYNDLATYTHFGFQLPPIKVLANRVDNTNNAKDVINQVRELFHDDEFKAQFLTPIEFLPLVIPARVAYREANAYCTPIHRYAESEYETMQGLCKLLFPQWAEKF
ncbi:ParA family protein [Aggregatibacter actinomycetemcomitans]|uniref:ParA family protein n=1 Tax=Aggregatibacter actinomycetemcomitans TaxID=714 RepID=UPI0011DB94A1|nr:ParA family protein [Aggregatibacter actinomycetemcomitans]TYA49278.1 ParA family protein [Aggregatibacter actinomycetemcomitans]